MGLLIDPAGERKCSIDGYLKYNGERVVWKENAEEKEQEHL